MPEPTTITGNVTFPKLMLDRDLFTQEPANRASAFLDLWRLANDRARSIKIAGRDVQLKRGQLGYSQLTLAKLWRWDKEKVRRVLIEFQNEGLITFDSTNTTTIITVLDYPIYNADSGEVPEAEPPTEPLPEPLPVPPTEPLQKWEGGRGKKEGGGAAREAFAEKPSDSEFLAFAAAFPGEPASGAPGPIPELFALDVLSRYLGRDRFPTEWRRLLALEWRKAFRGFVPAGPAPDPLTLRTPGNGVPQKTGGLTARKITLERELAAAQENEDAALTVGAAEDEARWRTVRRRLEAELETLKQKIAA